MNPEDVLDELALADPGLEVRIEPGQRGHTLLRLVAKDGSKVITVIEPPGGFPVRVIHHHAEDGVETEYAYCGEGHCPNTPHPDAVGADAKLTRAEWERLDRQKGHGKIGSGEALKGLCARLAASEQTKQVRARGEREARRKARQAAFEAARAEAEKRAKEVK
jgi:hypothetical protein